VPFEQFGNVAYGTVTSIGGGSPTPSAGTVQTWTVTATSPDAFSAANNTLTPPTQFHVSDPATGASTESVLVTNATFVSGSTWTWTVTRGAEGTAPVNHGATFTVYQVASAGSLGNLVQAFSVRSVQYGAKGDGSTDDTAAIQAAVTACAGAGVVYFPPGTYKLSSALTVGTGVTLCGAGQTATTLHQSSTTANAITIGGTTVANVQIRDLTITGPSSGSGVGISASANAGANPVVQLVIRNVTVSNMGSHGISLLVPIVSTFDNVVSNFNGGRGWYVTGVPSTGIPGTSLSFTACYANTNALDGWYLQTLTYCSLNGCASDTNGTGYVLAGCQGVVLNGCGAESTVAKNSLTGNSFTITSDSSSNPSSGVTLNGCYTLVNNAIAFWVTGSSVNITLIGLRENSPGGSATSSITTATGTVTTLIGYQVTTATSLGGTYNVLNDGTTGQFSAAGTSYLGVTNLYGGNLDVATVGFGLKVAEGSGAKQGTATLNGTTAVVVSNTSVTATSRIFLTIQAPGGGTTGSPYVSARTAGTSFSIKSTGAGDTSTVAYEIFEVG
jgi:hypothetical protein